MNILITLLFGAIAGWLAGFFVIKEKGGLIWNIIIGGPCGMARSSAPSSAPWS